MCMIMVLTTPCYIITCHQSITRLFKICVLKKLFFFDGKSLSFCSQDPLRFFSLSTDTTVLRTFYVNYNGAIILLRPLSSTDNFFDFNVRVTDDRAPIAKSDDASVRITINHVKFSPEFQDLPYTATVRLDRSVSNSPILRVRATDQNLVVNLKLFL